MWPNQQGQQFASSYRTTTPTPLLSLLEQSKNHQLQQSYSSFAQKATPKNVPPPATSQYQNQMPAFGSNVPPPPPPGVYTAQFGQQQQPRQSTYESRPALITSDNAQMFQQHSAHDNRHKQSDDRREQAGGRDNRSSMSGAGNSAQQSGESRTFTGRVTRKLNLYGFIDDEVFFQDSAVVGGRKPEEGDEVQVTAEFNPGLPMKWTAKSVYVSRAKDQMEMVSRKSYEDEERKRRDEQQRNAEHAKHEAMAKAAIEELQQVRQQQARAAAETAKLAAENERLQRELMQRDVLVKEHEQRIQLTIREQQQLAARYQAEIAAHRDSQRRAEERAEQLRRQAEAAQAQASALAAQRGEHEAAIARAEAARMHAEAIAQQAHAQVAANAVVRAQQAESDTQRNIVQLFANEQPQQQQQHYDPFNQFVDPMDAVRRMVSSAVGGGNTVQQMFAAPPSLLGDPPGMQQDERTLHLQHQALIDDIISEARLDRLGSHHELQSAQRQLVECLSKGVAPSTALAHHLLERMYARMSGATGLQPSFGMPQQQQNDNALPLMSVDTSTTREIVELFGRDARPPSVKRDARAPPSRYSPRQPSSGSATHRRDSAADRRSWESSGSKQRHRGGDEGRMRTRSPTQASSSRRDGGKHVAQATAPVARDRRSQIMPAASAAKRHRL